VQKQIDASLIRFFMHALSVLLLTYIYPVMTFISSFIQQFPVDFNVSPVFLFHLLITLLRKEDNDDGKLYAVVSKHS